MSDAKGFNVSGSPVLAKDEAARNQIAIMNAVSAVAFNNRVDRNWDGQGSIVANATDVTTDFNNGTLSTKIANMDFDDYDTGMQIKKTITVNNNIICSWNFFITGVIERIVFRKNITFNTYRAAGYIRFAVIGFADVLL